MSYNKQLLLATDTWNVATLLTVSSFAEYSNGVLVDNSIVSINEYSGDKNRIAISMRLNTLLAFAYGIDELVAYSSNNKPYSNGFEKFSNPNLANKPGSIKKLFLGYTKANNKRTFYINIMQGGLTLNATFNKYEIRAVSQTIKTHVSCAKESFYKLQILEKEKKNNES